MERLKSDLNAMIMSVQEKLEKNLSPSTEQLIAFVTGITDALVRDATALPPAIRNLCRDSFSAMGWNVRKKTITEPNLFTPEKLLETLKSVLNQISNFEPPVVPTQEELNDLSLACCKLWELDTNRLVPGKDYAIDLQNQNRRQDDAPQPLFSYVDESVLSRPTFQTFVALLDNYTAQVGVTERVTQSELQENSTFLHHIMQTPCMRYLHQYLLAKGKTSNHDVEGFIRELNHFWFDMYSRKKTNDSSGFEHVFIGEVNENGEVIGMHNWIQLYNEERNNRLDYRGYIAPRGSSRNWRPNNDDQLVTIQFRWNGGIKPVSSSFIGTSPEFEVALYTICFYTGEVDNIVRVGPYRVKVTCYRWSDRRTNIDMISTSFPGEVPPDEDMAASRIQATVRGRQCRTVGAEEYHRRQQTK